MIKEEKPSELARPWTQDEWAQECSWARGTAEVTLLRAQVRTLTLIGALLFAANVLFIAREVRTQSQEMEDYPTRSGAETVVRLEVQSLRLQLQALTERIDGGRFSATNATTTTAVSVSATTGRVDAATADPKPAGPRRLWASGGDDSVMVPYGFADCTTTAMPPEFAPVRAAGDFFYFSGIAGYLEPCKSVIPDREAQIEKAFYWLAQMLETSKLTFPEVLSVTAYHVGPMAREMDTLVRMREKYWPVTPYPAWTSVQVEGLWYPEAIFMVQIVARRKSCSGVQCDR